MACKFFIFDHVTFNQFKNCYCVQNFMKMWWFFTEIWRYIDFKNGGRPPSCNCFTTIRDHTHEVCVAGRWPHACQISCQSYLGPQNGGFGGFWTPKCYYSSSRPPKGTSLRKSASVKLSTVKIRWGVWPRRVDRKCDGHTDTHTHTGKFMFCPCIA